MNPLLLTGPPAAGKSTTARALAQLRAWAAVIDVDDIRQLVVSGHAAPWDGDEGRRQQLLGVRNACDLAVRLTAAGFDVVLSDVVDTRTIGVYRQHLPDLVIIRLSLSLTEAWRRAATRPVYLTDKEFEDLHAADVVADLPVDATVEVEGMTQEDQTAAAMRVWSTPGGRH